VSHHPQLPPRLLVLQPPRSAHAADYGRQVVL
jgi:hypothetical protein